MSGRNAGGRTRGRKQYVGGKHTGEVRFLISSRGSCMTRYVFGFGLGTAVTSKLEAKTRPCSTTYVPCCTMQLEKLSLCRHPHTVVTQFQQRREKQISFTATSQQHENTAAIQQCTAPRQSSVLRAKYARGAAVNLNSRTHAHSNGARVVGIISEKQTRSQISQRDPLSRHPQYDYCCGSLSDYEREYNTWYKKSTDKGIRANVTTMVPSALA